MIFKVILEVFMIMILREKKDIKREEEEYGKRLFRDSCYILLFFDLEIY